MRKNPAAVPCSNNNVQKFKENRMNESENGRSKVTINFTLIALHTEEHVKIRDPYDPDRIVTEIVEITPKPSAQCIRT